MTLIEIVVFARVQISPFDAGEFNTESGVERGRYLWPNRCKKIKRLSEKGGEDEKPTWD